MRYALEAKKMHEVRSRTAYDLAVVMRHDIVFLRPVRLTALPAAQVWFPEHCCSWMPSIVRPGVPPAITSAYQTMKETCYGTNGRVPDLCRATQMIALGHGDISTVTVDAERNYFVNDWLFVAPSVTADTFAEMEPRIDSYKKVLREVGISKLWLHFLFAAHIHAINTTAGLRAGISAEFDISLARNAASQRFPGSCLSNMSVPLPPIEEPLAGGMENACPRRGIITCSKSLSLFCVAGFDREQG
jgi:hypothetical protein